MNEVRPHNLDYGVQQRTKWRLYGPNWFLHLAVPGVLFWCLVTVRWYIQPLIPQLRDAFALHQLEEMGELGLYSLAFVCGIGSFHRFSSHRPQNRQIYIAICVLIHISIFAIAIYFMLFVLSSD
jgi:hypothetical protein